MVIVENDLINGSRDQIDKNLTVLLNKKLLQNSSSVDITNHSKCNVSHPPMKRSFNNA